MPRIITTVPHIPKLERPMNVAAYARVSSGKDAMLHSLSAQVSYYSKLIQQHTGWRYAGVYADEAMTGTKEARGEFQRMLTDCRSGKIDMIITKSISRFARNTVTLLETVRELKLLGIDVHFEEQNLHSMSADGELMLSILASYAQEESLSASENQKWRVRKGFQNGELMNLRFLFGYTILKGAITINPEEAAIVRDIYKRAIGGESMSAISRDLNKRGVSCVLGGKWDFPRVHNILSNEKYTGNALLQKHFRNNHLEKRKCQNTGELPKYYAEKTHPAIIDEETYQAAQAVLIKWQVLTSHRAKQHTNEFTGLIRCPYCGKNYKRVKSNTTIAWNCNTYLAQGKRYCHGKKIPEVALKAACALVLEHGAYRPERVKEEIAQIEVPEDNKLRFVLKDGHTKECTWADRSRAESWTPEMKELARERTIKREEINSCQQ